MRNITFCILILIIAFNNSCTKRPNIVVESNDKFLVYPNPCIDLCTASLNNPPGNNYTITIYNTEGNEMRKVEGLSGSDRLIMDLSNEAVGKYIAIASNGIVSYSETFFKVKQ